MLENDAILSKISIIKNCLSTIQRVTELKESKLDDFMIQDVFIINLQRAIQAAIDIANIIISINGFKLPASYKESFSILFKNNIITENICKVMMNMVGFRNIAIHDYQELDIEILKSVLKNNLKDFIEFYTQIYNNLNLEN